MIDYFRRKLTGKLSEVRRNLEKFAFWREEVEVFVFGTSILWGQGLRDEAKISSLLARHLTDVRGYRVKVHSFAHSGAHLRGGTGVSGLHGEVPTPSPNVMEQIEAAPAARGLETIVLVEGGINEVGGSRIIDFRTETRDLAELTRSSCRDGMSGVLAEISRKFPRAHVFVPGYYSLLASDADSGQMESVYDAELRDRPAGNESFVERSTGNAQLFHELSDRYLKEAVDTARDEHNLDCHFVDSGFRSANGLFGSDCLLYYPWEFDPMISLRRRECTKAIATQRTGVHCYLAAAFHPDERGARRYADQVIAAVERVLG